MKVFASTLAAILLLGTALPGVSMAKGGFFPTYHPPASCEDGQCKGDDARNELPCQGLMCSWASSKSLQPPVTAAQAAEAEKARVAAETAATALPPEPTVKRKTRSVTRPKKSASQDTR